MNAAPSPRHCAVAEHQLTGHKVAIKILNRNRIRQLDMDENKEIIDDIVEYPLPPTQHHSGVCYGSACFGVTFGLGAASCLSALVFAVPCLLRDEAKADPDHEGSPLLPEPPPGPARTPPA